MVQAFKTDSFIFLPIHRSWPFSRLILWYNDRVSDTLPLITQYTLTYCKVFVFAHLSV